MSVSVDIKRQFRNFSLDVSFSAGDGRTGILGASGCGKSMTLKSVAGIETPDSGVISIDGDTVFDSGRNVRLAPQKRKAGYLFQSYALFPAMTVEQNIAIASGGKKDRVAELLKRFRISELSGQYPSQLSGGQQQRVALARMLAPSPRIILLDEPFSALDAFLRRQVEDELSLSLSGFPGTILFVSHDRDEVFRFCERIIVIDAGRIARDGTRDEVFADPRTVPAARLTGCKNIAPARKTGERRIEVADWGLVLETAAPVPDDITHAGIRAHHIRSPRNGETQNCFDFAIERKSETPFSASEYLTALNAGPAGENRMPLYRENSEHLSPTASVRLCVPADKLLLLC
jgi:molybdate transport system ATP-binding protein